MEYPKFKVTVSCMTYNQSKYITDAMNGFTMQQTSFPFVCTIVDDASTDGEQEVISKYVEENFDLSEDSEAFRKETDYAHIIYAQHKTNKNCYFAVLFLKENHYSQKKDKYPYVKEWHNGVEYMAICEGDDYWIDVYKLQKQVKILDNSKTVGLTYSKARKYEQNRGEFTGIVGKEYTGLSDLMINNPIVTLTTCFRTNLYLKYIEEIQPQHKNWLLGDLPLWIWIAERSEIYYFDEYFAVYRLLEKSASHSNSLSSIEDFSNSILNVQLFFYTRFYDKLKSDLQKDVFLNAHHRRCAREAFRLKERKYCYQQLRMVFNKTFKEKLKFLICGSSVIFRSYFFIAKIIF